MKIGVVTPRYPPNIIGGGEVSVQLLVENLRKFGHDVEVLSFDGDSVDADDPSYVTREPLSTDRNDLGNVLSYRTIRDFAEDKDAVHSYNMTFHPAVAMLNNTESVATLNGYQYYHPYNVPGVDSNPSFMPYRVAYEWLCRRVISRMDSIVALSQEVKKFYSRFLPEDKIEVVPNMLDTRFPEFNDIETDESEILYVGALTDSKDVGALIDAMQQLEDHHLRIVGDGEKKQELEQQTQNLGLGDRVKFEGYVNHDKLPRYYERAGWFVHPAKWPEPFNRTLIEAMQMDTPVIATDIGGPKNVLPDEQLVEEMKDLPGTIKNLDRDETVEKQRSIIQEFKPENVVNSLEKIYRGKD